MSKTKVKAKLDQVEDPKDEEKEPDFYVLIHEGGALDHPSIIGTARVLDTGHITISIPMTDEPLTSSWLELVPNTAKV